MVLDEVGHGEHDGAHAEAEGPGQEDHPPPTAGLHDDGVAHSLHGSSFLADNLDC